MGCVAFLLFSMLRDYYYFRDIRGYFREEFWKDLSVSGILCLFVLTLTNVLRLGKEAYQIYVCFGLLGVFIYCECRKEEQEENSFEEVSRVFGVMAAINFSSSQFTYVHKTQRLEIHASAANFINFLFFPLNKLIEKFSSPQIPL